MLVGNMDISKFQSGSLHEETAFELGPIKDKKGEQGSSMKKGRVFQAKRICVEENK